MEPFAYLRLLGKVIHLVAVFSPSLAASLTFRLFCTPRRTPVKEKEKLFLATAQREDITLANVRIVTYSWGNGPKTILLAYGWEYNSGRWRHFVPSLVAAGFRVIAFDMPAHGQAPGRTHTYLKNVQLLRALMVKYGPIYGVVAHSFGGSSTMGMLSEIPPSEWPEKTIIMASFSNMQRVFDEFSERLQLKQSIRERFEAFIEKLSGKPLSYYDLGRLVSHVQSNALIIHSKDDTVTPVNHSESVYSKWPSANLWTPDQLGHHLGHAIVTEAVVAFLSDGALPKGTQAAKVSQLSL